ncbi:MAG: hypothetical protein CVV27_14670 [Candidatus Melainabacteria bacterium HGW-Melainabacteria-1]|nr:MAG: hypothetical protein CVV27_14670 [Candidatus Melainabacteria bacterium HGW-Melainabacteria-1]
MRSVALETTTPARSWDVKSPDAVRFGQVTVSQGKAGGQLSVSRLSAAQPTPTSASELGVVTPDLKAGPWPLGSLANGLPARHRLDYGAYLREPAYAEASVVSEPDLPTALVIGADPNPAGFCGLWMRIYDPDAGTALDARQAEAIGFWIKGTPGLPVEVKLADAKWQQKQDSLLIGPLTRYLAGGRLTGEWQLAKVPIPKTHHNLNPANLTQLVLDIKGQSHGQLRLHSLALLKAGQQMPARLPSKSAQNVGRAVWLWQTDQFLDPVLRKGILNQLQAEGVRRLFVQLSGREGGQPGEVQLDRNAWLPAIRDAQASGIQVHALDGDPRYAQDDWHPGVLATVRSVLAYNQAAPPDARFGGIQYDIEPYLLPGYFGAREQELKQGLIRLIDGMSTLRRPGFEIGLAVPFWLDSPDEFTGQWPWLSFRGQQRQLSEHLIDRVDYLALMSYRTSLHGRSGLLANIRHELAMANRLGKGILVGLETSPLPHESSYLFTGAPQRGWPQPSQRDQLAIAGGPADTWRIWWIPGGETPPPAPVDPVWHWPLKTYSVTTPESLSFATLGWPKLRETVEALEYQLQGAPSFQGVVLHDQQGVARLLAQRP